MPAALDQALDRPVTRISQGDLTVRDAFARVLSGLGAPGALELLQCGYALPRLVIGPDSTARAALAQIRGVQPDLDLRISENGMVKMLSSSGHLDLLNTKISDLRLTDLGQVMASLRQVLQAPEVKSRIGDLKLQERAPELGFTAIPKPGAATAPADPRVLHDTTVEDALDVIAKGGAGNRVWVYEENECADPRTFTISFLVR